MQPKNTTPNTFLNIIIRQIKCEKHKVIVMIIRY